MKRKIFTTAVALLGAAAVASAAPRKAVPAAAARPAKAPAAARPAPAPARAPTKGPALAYRPAGTVAFANLETIAQTVKNIAGPGSKDLILTTTLPNAIRRPGAAMLFGAMRPGSHGVAVCYVEPTISARLANTKRPSDADLDRVKRWTVVYPTTMTRAAFQKNNPTAVPDAMNTFRVPPGRHSQRTLWAWFAPDGQWAVLGPSPAMAANAYNYSYKARQRAIGSDLAYIQMDSAGARAVFGSGILSGGMVAVRMGRNGLELRGSGRLGAELRKPFPPGAMSFAGIPPETPLFGVTTTLADVQMAVDLFALGGPEFTAYIQQSLRFVHGKGASGYFIDGTAAKGTGLSPAQRLDKILPEARMMPSAGNAMFCSPTTVMRHCLPKVAAKMGPFDSAKLQVVLRLLRQVRGDGMGAMSWREGDEDKFFIRISRDELWGTANLWSTMLL